jgi:hypothetical protein
MARSKLRAAAGAGTVAAFLLVGGAAAAMPVVSADPGHSHGGNGSHRGGDSRDGDRDFSRADGRRGERDRDDDGGGTRGGDSTGPRRGGSPSATNDLNGIEPDDGVARIGALEPSRTEPSTRSGTTSRSAVGSDSSVSVSEAPIAARSVEGLAPPAPLPPTPAGAAGSDLPVSGGGGASPAAVAAPPITRPRVTVGNGRAPGILTGRRAKAPTGEIPVASPAVPPPVVTPQLPAPYRLEVTPAERMVASLWAAAAPGWPGGLLFGLAGLVLAPIAGAWLGVRQARASKAAAQLIRH